MARNILKDYFKGKPEEVPIMPEVLSAPPAEETDSADREHTCLEQCLGETTPRNRELLLDYYREEGGAKIERHQEMARRRGITPNALRILVCRLRARFKKCMRECLEAEAT